MSFCSLFLSFLFSCFPFSLFMFLVSSHLGYFFYLFLVYASNFSSIFFRRSLSHSLYCLGDIYTELISPDRMFEASEHSTSQTTDKQLAITFCFTNVIWIKMFIDNHITLLAPANISIKLRNELYSI